MKRSLQNPLDPLPLCIGGSSGFMWKRRDLAREFRGKEKVQIGDAGANPGQRHFVQEQWSGFVCFGPLLWKAFWSWRDPVSIASIQPIDPPFQCMDRCCALKSETLFGSVSEEWKRGCEPIVGNLFVAINPDMRCWDRLKTEKQVARAMVRICVVRTIALGGFVVVL